MIYSIWEQIAYLPTVMSLAPGDILATGAPVGIVGFMPKRFLTAGDVVRVEGNGFGYREYGRRRSSIDLGAKRMCAL